MNKQTYPGNGNFTSSEIYLLTKSDRSGKNFGAPALSYIEEKNMERRLGMSIDSESNARPLSWGRHLEPFAAGQAGIEYDLHSDDCMAHPTMPNWYGTPDTTKNDDTVGDFKCPMTRKSFCKLVDPLYRGLQGQAAIDWIRDNHPDGEKYYWQLVSNSIITGRPYAELLPYMPYRSDLHEIMMLAADKDDCYWIANANPDELPYINKGGYYKDLNVIRWEVSQADKDFLTERVGLASVMLEPWPVMVGVD